MRCQARKKRYEIFFQVVLASMVDKTPDPAVLKIIVFHFRDF